METILYREPTNSEIEEAKKAGFLYNPIKHRGVITYWRLEVANKKKSCGCGKKRP